MGSTVHAAWRNSCREEPVLIDVEAGLRGFSGDGCLKAENYLAWIRSVAEAAWVSEGVEELPWWVEAEHVDEIAVPHRYQDAKTFDGQDPPEFSNHLEFREFTHRYEKASGNDLNDLARRRRNSKLMGRENRVCNAGGWAVCLPLPGCGLVVQKEPRFGDSMAPY
jgi:hypothetical protein